MALINALANSDPALRARLNVLVRHAIRSALAIDWPELAQAPTKP
jgi:hypothetical protein